SVQRADDHHHGVFLRIGGKKLHHAEGAGPVARSKGFVQLEDVVLPADADVLLDLFAGDGGALRDVEGQLVDLIGYFRQVSAQVFGDQARFGGADDQLFFLAVLRNPVG